MRIVYLHQYFKSTGQPGGTRSYEFARRLVVNGHEVHMVSSTQEGADCSAGWRHSVVAGVQVHACRLQYSNMMSYRKRMAAFARFALRAGHRAASLRPQVVFASSTPLTIAMPAVYAAHRARVPMVFEVRDLWPEVPLALGAIRGAIPTWAAHRLETFAYHNAARVVALSPTMKAGIVRTGYPEDRVHVIPNGCDLDLFAVDVSRAEEEFRHRHGWLGGRPLVLYAGTFGLVNGVGYLVEVAKAMYALNRDVRFLLLGDGREAAQVRQQAHDLGVLGRNLFIMPPIPKVHMPAVLSAATVAASTVIDVPALWANSANKVFDAFAAGRPVVINHEGWQADLLRESGAGIVLPARDPAGAARLLAEFLQDDVRLARARDAARHLAETRFARDLLFQEFERVLLLSVGEGRQ